MYSQSFARFARNASSTFSPAASWNGSEKDTYGFGVGVAVDVAGIVAAAATSTADGGGLLDGTVTVSWKRTWPGASAAAISPTSSSARNPIVIMLAAEAVEHGWLGATPVGMPSGRSRSPNACWTSSIVRYVDSDQFTSWSFASHDSIAGGATKSLPSTCSPARTRQYSSPST